MTRKKAETKNDPRPTDDAAPSRVTMDTVVTDGPGGMDRLRALTARLLSLADRDTQTSDPKG